MSFKNCKRKQINKENESSHTTKVPSKRSRLSTLATSNTSYTNVLVEAASLFGKACEDSLFKLSSTDDSQDSGFGNSCMSPIQAQITDLNDSFELDELNACCITNSVKTAKKLDTSLNGSFTTRRCLFKSSPLSSQPSTPVLSSKLLFNDSIVENSESSPRKMTPVSVRQNSIFSPVASTIAEQSLCEIEQMIQLSTKYITTSKFASLNDQHIQIMQSLDIECQQKQTIPIPSAQTARLIGDRSTYHILPTVSHLKHNDLNVITPDTMINVLNGEYSEQIDSLVVIDARYPYEYDGGHIRTAKNVYTKEKIMDMFFNDENLKQANERANAVGKRCVIIFHCEFSSERGPGMLRFLRNQDRCINKDNYPKLCYPELYLLEGGYKAFYEQSTTFCEPKSYKPMLHEDHVMDLKHFRAKTKLWNRFSSSNNCASANKNNIFKSRLQRFPRSTLF